MRLNRLHKPLCRKLLRSAVLLRRYFFQVVARCTSENQGKLAPLLMMVHAVRKFVHLP